MRWFRAAPPPSVTASPGVLREAEKIARRYGTSVRDVLRFFLSAGAFESRKARLRREQRR